MVKQGGLNVIPGHLKVQEMVISKALSSSQMFVVCLCAQWCGTCRGYQSIFDSLRPDFAGRAHFVWLDIEDQADNLGFLEVENFPSILMSCKEQVRFFGVLPPHRHILEKTVEHALLGPLMTAIPPEVLALAHWMHSLDHSDPFCEDKRAWRS